MSRRLYSQKKESSKAKQISEIGENLSKRLDMPDSLSRMGCQCSKYGEDKCEKCRNLLPPVNAVKYQGTNGKIYTEANEIGASPRLTIEGANDYFNSHKYLSKKYQHLTSNELPNSWKNKIKGEERHDFTMYSNVQKTQGKFDGMIEGSGIQQKNYYINDPWQRKYLDEWSEHAKQVYVNPEDRGSHPNGIVNGFSTMHGSQSFKNAEALLENKRISMFTFKEKQTAANRVHSIGYAQNSTDSHRGPSTDNPQSLKEKGIKNRPTSSSSSFMYTKPLIGFNQKFQPLDEDIPEEKERITKVRGKNGRRKRKNKKIIRCVPNTKKDEQGGKERPNGIRRKQSPDERAQKNVSNNTEQILLGNKLRKESQDEDQNGQDEHHAQENGSANTDVSNPDLDRFLEPIYREDKESGKNSNDEHLLKPNYIKYMNNSNPVSPRDHSNFFPKSHRLPKPHFARSHHHSTGNKSFDSKGYNHLISVKSFELQPRLKSARNNSESNISEDKNQCRSHSVKDSYLSVDKSHNEGAGSDKHKNKHPSSRSTIANQQPPHSMEKRSLENGIETDRSGADQIPMFSNMQVKVNIAKEKNSENEKDSQPEEPLKKRIPVYAKLEPIKIKHKRPVSSHFPKTPENKVSLDLELSANNSAK